MPQSVKKYIANPILGILPFVLYIILQTYLVDEIYAFGISIVSAVLAELFLRRIFNTQVLGITFYITATSLLFTALLWHFAHAWVASSYTYIIFVEVIIILQLMSLRVTKTFLVAKISERKSIFEDTLLHYFFTTSSLLQYTLTAHALCLLIYNQLAHGYVNDVLEQVIYVIIPVLLIGVLIVEQFIRVNAIFAKLEQEEWWPIVTEKGEVKGKITKEVSTKLKNMHMHPIVRVALICNKKVYLQNRKADCILNPGRLDYPFEKYMLFDHQVTLSVRNSIERMVGHNIVTEPTSIFKYVFENEDTKRLVFLYAIEIDDECKITRTENMTGKFWSVKQIDEEFGSDIFSECFEMEYEYLKHMVLLKDGDSHLFINGEKPSK